MTLIINQNPRMGLTRLNKICEDALNKKKAEQRDRTLAWIREKKRVLKKDSWRKFVLLEEVEKRLSE